MVVVKLVMMIIIMYHLIKMIFFEKRQNVQRNRAILMFHPMTIIMKQHKKLYQVIVLN